MAFKARSKCLQKLRVSGMQKFFHRCEFLKFIQITSKNHNSCKLL